MSASRLDNPLAGVRTTLGLPFPRKRLVPLPTIVELLWAFVGFVLTVGGTLCRFNLPDCLPQALNLTVWPPTIAWTWQPGYPFSLQIAAVLLSGCIGGPVAGGLAQVAYLAVGLAGIPVFTDGGGLAYLAHPSSGFLVAFVPAAIVTGALAFRCRSNLNWLAASALAGLLIIHVLGLVGLIARLPLMQLGMAAVQYSALPLLGHAICVLLAATVGWIVRKLLLS